jgi:hypothetical protein
MFMLLAGIAVCLSSAVRGSIDGPRLQHRHILESRSEKLVCEDPPGVTILAKRKALFAPPRADYNVVHSKEEYFQVLRSARGASLSIRYADDLRVINVGAQTGVLAHNVSVVLDCQGGAMVQDPSVPVTSATPGTYVDIYNCILYGSSHYGGAFATRQRLNDVLLLIPCLVCSRSCPPWKSIRLRDSWRSSSKPALHRC